MLQEAKLHSDKITGNTILNSRSVFMEVSILDLRGEIMKICENTPYFFGFDQTEFSNVKYLDNLLI